jgi:hypothetical protein
MSDFDSPEFLDLDTSAIVFNEKDFVSTGKSPMLKEGYYKFEVSDAYVSVSKYSGNLQVTYRAYPIGEDGEPKSPWHRDFIVLPVPHPVAYRTDQDYKEDFDKNRADYLKKFYHWAYALKLKMDSPEGPKDLPPRPISKSDGEGNYTNYDPITQDTISKEEFFRMRDACNKSVGAAAIKLINSSGEPDEYKRRPVELLNGTTFYGKIAHSKAGDKCYLNRPSSEEPDEPLVSEPFKFSAEEDSLTF